MYWHIKCEVKSAADTQDLIRLLLSPEFVREDLNVLPFSKMVHILDQLDEIDPHQLFQGAGWKKSNVHIQLPSIEKGGEPRTITIPNLNH